jgi:hypothetical protein
MGQRNVGGVDVLDAGLILLGRNPIVDENEYGLHQGTLRFELRNSKYVDFRMNRGVACPDFIAGDDLTGNVLAELDYLACQTKRFTRNGAGPGRGLLDVLCQGAIFDSNYENGEATPYYFVPGSTKEDVSFTIYQTPEELANTYALCATTADLGPVVYEEISDPPGIILRQAETEIAARLEMDGIRPSLGNRVLVKNQSDPVQNGLYIVTDIGLMDGHTHWRMRRHGTMDEDSEVTADQVVSIYSGDTQANTFWQCDPDTPVTLGTTDINYTQLVATAGAYVPTFEVQISYYAIDLHFQYVAKNRQQRPRYLQAEYELGDGNLVTVAEGIELELFVEKVQGRSLLAGSTGTWGRIDDDVWRNGVNLIGSASRFEQPQKGQVFDVLETTTIKIDPILPPLDLITPESP